MRPDSIPIELVDLENRLLARTSGEPSAALRDRVLQSIVRELALPPQPASAGKSADWHWAAIAAAALIVINSSMISASRTEFSIWPTASRNQTAAEIQALRLLETQQEGTFK